MKEIAQVVSLLVGTFIIITGLAIGYVVLSAPLPPDIGIGISAVLYSIFILALPGVIIFIGVVLIPSLEKPRIRKPQEIFHHPV